METQELYSLLRLPPEISEKLHAAGSRIDLPYVEPYLRQMMEIETAPLAYQFLSGYFQDDPDHLQLLWAYLECARRCCVKYRQKGIPMEVFLDTMLCFRRFLDECQKKNGGMYFDRGWWCWRQVSMKIFRIGALEYEFRDYEGRNAAAIHIPSDASFSPDSVDASLKSAGDFFSTYYPDYRYNLYVCHSWLLSPALKPLLSSNSHILNFQKRFTVIREDWEDREYIDWLFWVPSDTAYQNLPAATSLQKRAKELLLNGGKIGSALGILDRS